MPLLMCHLSRYCICLTQNVCSRADHQLYIFVTIRADDFSCVEKNCFRSIFLRSPLLKQNDLVILLLILFLRSKWIIISAGYPNMFWWCFEKNWMRTRICLDMRCRNCIHCDLIRASLIVVPRRMINSEFLRYLSFDVFWHFCSSIRRYQRLMSSPKSNVSATAACPRVITGDGKQICGF